MRLALITLGLWLAILVLAIINAGVRELVLAPTFGSSVALPLSGLTLSGVIILVAWASMSFYRSAKSATYITVGAIWCFLTLSFELLFGHFYAGQSMSEILQVFNVPQGNLFILVVLSTLIAPWATAHAKGLI